ncbi:MAG TPA: vWA domain-containing protein [Polyangiaceae bacterium]|nr:vWA domain-containing protein [Polyangiaceae bacterium]
MVRSAPCWAAFVGFVGLIAVTAIGACTAQERHAGGVPAAGSGANGGGFAQGGEAPCVVDGACGDDEHQIALDVPNIYFVIDRSGSMEALVPPDNDDTRYAVVRGAAVELVRSLGSLVNVGAAVFPLGDIEADGCTDGGEVFPVSPGDPLDGDGVDGPTTKSFAFATKLTPKGGTPIAATLDKIAPILSGLEGRTFVLLLTDGGPNCNAGAVCGIAECMPNMEGLCTPSENCCVADHPDWGPLHCLDRPATVAAVQAIADAGIPVYVIGIPGSEVYGTVLDQMAVAGGVAPTGQYLRVDDLHELGQVFAQIAADAIRCEISLSDPPADKGFTNVYFDCESVPYDEVDGWTWVGDDVVELHGAACAALKSGQVAQVKVASGCPTEIPK